MAMSVTVPRLNVLIPYSSTYSTHSLFDDEKASKATRPFDSHVSYLVSHRAVLCLDKHPTSPSLQATCLTTFYFLYRAALSRPIPGIPYKAPQFNSVLGSFPDQQQHGKRRGGQLRYMGHLMNELNFPVMQFFARPCGRPWALVADLHEARDVLTRRTREFDRRKFFGDVTRALLHLLAGTVGPMVEKMVRDLIGLWTKKSRLADGRPFNGKTDVYEEALGVVWTVTFGSDSASTTHQPSLLSNLDTVALPAGTDHLSTSQARDGI
ncbi:uncharacterized protein LTR77_008080 [Saxophila tyrrhenica]|uniref:Uncharacterized protein n=1 Tax=Saxophila tyrrhenica TaxID=1690608 RepID=A0AAV9P2K2_9PEZI|nr:hypothetical protein LTR77_008080 [Saxophila tyrrhenica]